MTEPEKLTDAQVAELKALSQADLDSIAQDLAEGGTHPFDGDECVYCKKDRGVVALAREVQASRARRCGECEHMSYDEDAQDNLCDRLPGVRLYVTDDFFCAGFLDRDRHFKEQQ